MTETDAERKKTNKQTNWKRITIVLIWTTIIFNIDYLGLAAIVFDFIDFSYGFPILTIITIISWIVLLPLEESKYNEIKSTNPFKTLLWSIFLKAKTKPFIFIGEIRYSSESLGVCISSEPIEVTTRYSRSLESPVCEGPTPCHVYLTLPEDPAHKIYVNFQTDSPQNDPMIYFDITSRSGPLSSYAYMAKAKGFAHKTKDFNRGIYWVLLDNLSPNTIYYFRVGYGTAQENYSPENSFSTLPENGPLHFITGGDLSVTEDANKTSITAAQLDPMFAVLGGDIEYSNGFSSCYRKVDYFLRDWYVNMRTPLGRMIPFIMSLGNHEGGGYYASSSEIPFFMKWFPQSDDHDVADIDAAAERSTYHAHLLSDNTVLYVLDSAVHTTLDEQATWLEDQLSVNTRPNKLAVYHVPLYPSYRPYDTALSAEMRIKWGPLFDKYSLTVALENHDHDYKRSKPIKNNQVDENGTLYIGDGCWGVVKRSLTEDLKKEKWYLEKIDSLHFVFQVDVQTSFMNISAVAQNTTVFDTFSKTFL